ncbi:hypothetical protein J6590_092790 [Homalodisca vitripennis]|nr:hypothetical protein J6590_092790 [Homalodisca vitripennis]
MCIFALTAAEKLQAFKFYKIASISHRALINGYNLTSALIAEHTERAYVWRDRTVDGQLTVRHASCDVTGELLRHSCQDVTPQSVSRILGTDKPKQVNRRGESHKTDVLSPLTPGAQGFSSYEWDPLILLP